MGQATLLDRLYVKSILFSGHYLDEWVAERVEYDRDGEVHAGMNSPTRLTDTVGRE